VLELGGAGSRVVGRGAAWRCGWCGRDRRGERAKRAPTETTGICEPCLRARRSGNGAKRSLPAGGLLAALR